MQSSHFSFSRHHLVAIVIATLIAGLQRQTMAERPEQTRPGDQREVQGQGLAIRQSHVAFNADGSICAMRVALNIVAVWDVGSGKQLSRIAPKCDSDRCLGLALTAPGDRLMILYCLDAKPMIAMYETHTGRQISNAVIERLNFDEEKQQRISVAEEEQVEEYVKATGRTVRSFTPCLTYFPGYSLAPNGECVWMATGCAMDNNVFLLRIDTRAGKTEVLAYHPPQYPSERFYTRRVIVSPNGEEALALDEYHGFTLFDAVHRQPLRQCYNSTWSPAVWPCMAFCASKREAAFSQGRTSRNADLGSHIVRLDLQRGAVRDEKDSIPNDLGITSMAYSSKGMLLAGTTNGDVFRVSGGKAERIAKADSQTPVAVTVIVCPVDQETAIVAHVTKDNSVPIVSQWDVTAVTPKMLWHKSMETDGYLKRGYQPETKEDE